MSPCIVYNKPFSTLFRCFFNNIRINKTNIKRWDDAAAKLCTNRRREICVQPLMKSLSDKTKTLWSSSPSSTLSRAKNISTISFFKINNRRPFGGLYYPGLDKMFGVPRYIRRMPRVGECIIGVAAMGRVHEHMRAKITSLMLHSRVCVREHKHKRILRRPSVVIEVFFKCWQPPAALASVAYDSEASRGGERFAGICRILLLLLILPHQTMILLPQVGSQIANAVIRCISLWPDKRKSFLLFWFAENH